MVEPGATAAGTDAASGKGAWRYSSLGSVLLAADFYIGVPAGLLAGLIPALLGRLADGTAIAVLIAFGGALAAILAVVVGVKTILVSLLTDEYMAVLERADGGLIGALRPYAVVAWVCGTGTFLSFAAAVSWPTIGHHEAWLRWIVFGIPAALACWGLLGCVQLVGLSNFHVQQRAALLTAVREVRRRMKDSSTRDRRAGN